MTAFPGLTRDVPWVTPRRGTVAAGLACALAAWVLEGPDALLGGLLATLLVVAFFATGAVPVFLAGQAGLRARAGVALLVLSYALRLMLVLVLLAVAARSDVVHVPTLGVTVIVTALAWTGLQVAAVLRSAGAA